MHHFSLISKYESTVSSYIRVLITGLLYQLYYRPIPILTNTNINSNTHQYQYQYQYSSIPISISISILTNTNINTNTHQYQYQYQYQYSPIPISIPISISIPIFTNTNINNHEYQYQYPPIPSNTNAVWNWWYRYCYIPKNINLLHEGKIEILKCFITDLLMGHPVPFSQDIKFFRTCMILKILFLFEKLSRCLIRLQI